MNVSVDTQPRSYHLPDIGWWLLAFAIVSTVVGFHASLLRMADTWFVREEYSHGVLVPFISAFLVWQRKNELRQAEFTGSWTGVVVVVGALVLKLAGDMGTFYVLQEYAFLFLLYGLVLSLMGYKAFKIIRMPMLLMLFIIPLPEYLLQDI